MAGIFFRYDISPLKITVKQISRSYWLLLLELAGICAGVYATSGKTKTTHPLIFYLLEIVDFFLCVQG